MLEINAASIDVSASLHRSTSLFKAMNTFSATICAIALTLLAPRVLADSRSECRETNDDNKAIHCIDEGIYDPCDDATGSKGIWDSRCAWAHNTIAERRIKKAEGEIKALLSKNPSGKDFVSSFAKSEQQWTEFRKSYCNFTGKLTDWQVGVSPLLLGQCMRRIAEQRADELEILFQQLNDPLQSI